MNDKLTFTSNPVLQNTTVLVAGAGGTIGSALISTMNAERIIAVDISEYAIYKLQRANNKSNIHYVVGDISDSKFCNYLFEKYSVDYIFNAAAYKHVDMLQNEDNVYSVIKNNVMSTINLCECSSQAKALIHISSDKAVYPTNIMGYTKLWCERIVQHYATSSAKLKIVRFGNVYNSSGSFIETLQWQMDNKLPITITDNRMKRYFITINDASCLINKVVTLDDNNATYILDMGEEVDIVSIVDRLNINNSPIDYIGIRAGEKIQEQLVYDWEALMPTSDPLIKSIEWKPIDMADNINQLIEELSKDTLCTAKLSKIITTTMTL